MANLNKVMIIGNLTQDPDVRQTLSGKKVVTLSLAINRVEKDENGEKKQKTTYLYCKCYGKLGEHAERYLQKGKSVFVEGRLEMILWQDKQKPQPYGEEEEDISF